LLVSRSLVPSLVMMRRQQFLWACVFVALILAAVSAAAEGGFRRYLRLSQDVKSLKERNKRLGDDNVRLRREVEALRDDPRALERAAREELGLVKPGEIVFSLEGS
jgi:cell division protein FtsB